MAARSSPHAASVPPTASAGGAAAAEAAGGRNRSRSRDKQLARIRHCRVYINSVREMWRCVSAHLDHFRMDAAMILDMANRADEDLNEVENGLEMLRGSFAGLVLHIQTLNRVAQAWHASEP